MSVALSLDGAEVGILIDSAASNASASQGADAVAGVLVPADTACCTAVVPAGASKPHGR